MLTLQIFPPSVGLKSPSPFSTKAIALLEMSGLEYQLQPSDPRKAPNKKLPVLIDNGKIIPDSSLIQAHLHNVHGIDFDKALSGEQLAVAQAFRRMIEDHLYWVMVYSRWVDNAEFTRDSFFSAIPNPIRKLVFRMVVKQVRAALYHQGLGRHAPAQIYAFGAADLNAISQVLDDKDFFFGAEPTSIDACLYGMIANIIVPSSPSPLKSAALSHHNLVKYCDRFADRFNMAAA